jgi:hypothetical protein
MRKGIEAQTARLRHSQIAFRLAPGPENASIYDERSLKR